MIHGFFISYFEDFLNFTSQIFMQQKGIISTKKMKHRILHLFLVFAHFLVPNSAQTCQIMLSCKNSLFWLSHKGKNQDYMKRIYRKQNYTKRILYKTNLYETYL